MFYLQRFLNAQQSGGLYDNMPNYETALQEIRDGHKRTHWMWYVFPQMKGLGHSQLSDFYGIDGREEACAYIYSQKSIFVNSYHLYFSFTCLKMGISETEANKSMHARNLMVSGPKRL